eukprot:c10286_g1_i2.p1 GENE.c10286_g1_i2~~c10286_g1_i2.p1  ORF type:complete len:194 (+),score=34.28 c10286_g1_i2:61-642(+)
MAHSIIESLTSAVLNEKFCPEILPYEDEIVSDAKAQILEQEGVIAGLSDQFAIVLHKMDLDRVQYLLRTYLRVRMFKIETYVQLIAENDNQNLNVSYLSKPELKFAQQLQKAKETHINTSFLSALPDIHRALNKPGMVPKPDLNSYVFALANSDIGQFRVDDNDTFLISKGDIYLICYASIRDLVRTKQMQLI